MVDMPGGLIVVLKGAKAGRVEPKAVAPVLVTRSGKRQTVANVDRRIKTAIKTANKRLAELGIEPISERVTPHSLRRLYTSLRAALRDDPVYIAEQAGHTDPTFTYRVYQKAAKRREKLTGAYLREFDAALDWARRLGTSGHQEVVAGLRALPEPEASIEETRTGSGTNTHAPVAQPG